MSKNFLKGFTTIKLVIVTAICIILFMIIIPVITMKADVKIDFNKYATNKEKINFIDRLPIKVKNDLNLDFNMGVSLDRVETILKKYFLVYNVNI